MFIGSVKALLTSSAALISVGGLGSEMRGGWTCWGGRKGKGRGQIAVGCQAMKKSCKGAGKQRPVFLFCCSLDGLLVTPSFLFLWPARHFSG